MSEEQQQNSQAQEDFKQEDAHAPINVKVRKSVASHRLTRHPILSDNGSTNLILLFTRLSAQLGTRFSSKSSAAPSWASFKALMLLKSARTWAAFGEYICLFFFLAVDSWPLPYLCWVPDLLSILRQIFVWWIENQRRRHTCKPRHGGQWYDIILLIFSRFWKYSYVDTIDVMVERAHLSSSLSSFLIFDLVILSDIQRLAVRLPHICTVVAHNCITPSICFHWSISRTFTCIDRPLMLVDEPSLSSGECCVHFLARIILWHHLVCFVNEFRDTSMQAVELFLC